MESRRVFTVVLTGTGRFDEPCVATCPALGLRTDAPTVALALEAMSRAVATFDAALPEADTHRLPVASGIDA